MKLYNNLKIKVQNARYKVRKSIDYLLLNSYDYYTCLYPGNSGIISNFLIEPFISRIKIDKNNLKKIEDLQGKGIVIYASKHKSLLDFLLFHTLLKKHGIAYPEIGFDFKFIFLQPVKRYFRIVLAKIDFFIHHFKNKDPYSSGYITDQLSITRSGFLFLIEKNAFYQRFVKSSPDPLTLLIDMQQKMDTPIYIIPEAIVFGLNPTRKKINIFDFLLGTPEKPKKIRQLYTILNNPKKISVEISDPVNLKEFLKKPEIASLAAEFQTHNLRSYLVELTNNQIRSIIGPQIKTKQEITEDILTDKYLQEYLADFSSKENKTLAQTRKEAAAYIKEIAASYNIRFIQVLYFLLTWVFNNIFEGVVVDQEGLAKVKEASKEAPLIFVPCHKSHLDYLLIPYIMYANKMPTPHIAAGKNLSFWPLGPIFRSSGAFFLRRSFKGATLYKKIFDAYIKKLLSEGFNIKIYIEGGRSRSGKLLSPTFGLLSMVFNAYLSNACNNLIFVPIYVGYDRVLEEDAYLKELEGGKKDPESVSQIIKARKLLKKKYGKVYIKFDEPISLKDYISKKTSSNIYPGTEEAKAIIQDLGYKLVNSINSISIVTPHAIIASSVLNNNKGKFLKKEILYKTQTYMNFLSFFNIEFADTLTVDPDSSLNHVINLFISRNFLELADEDEGEITDDTYFLVKNNKRPILDYYKNNSLAFFIPAAYTATAILEKESFQFTIAELQERYKFLQNLFMDEFPFDEDKTCEDYISACVKAFMNDGIILPDKTLPDSYNITSSGFKKIKCFAEFLLPFLESYKTVLSYFQKYAKEDHEPKERIKTIQSLGLKMYKQNIVLLKESLSKINFINATEYCLKSGISNPKNKAGLKQLQKIIEKTISLLTS
ncbi:MAG: 1-acyl-sn-glycerol-3-phosphate acyltransferase [Desulfobacterales bacterium]|nr:1-acyl-sn-glycerol-3-phosphate acyltransferase [Desulfobacterales bacterium]